MEKNIDLVYGGGSVGLMGLISRTVFDGGCSVLGFDLVLHIKHVYVFSILTRNLLRSLMSTPESFHQLSFQMRYQKKLTGR